MKSYLQCISAIIIHFVNVMQVDDERTEVARGRRIVLCLAASPTVHLVRALTDLKSLAVRSGPGR